MLVVDYRGMLAAGASPSNDEFDPLSQAIVKDSCERSEQVEPGVVRHYLRG